MPRLVPTIPASAPMLPISPRIRGELVYFKVSAVADAATPESGDALRFDPEQASRWLEEGVITLVSPLDTAHMTEVELSDEQESLLRWIATHGVVAARLEE